MFTSNFTALVANRANSIFTALQDQPVKFSLVDSSNLVRVESGNFSAVVELSDIAGLIRDNYKIKATTTANNYKRVAAVVFACCDLGLSVGPFYWLRNIFNS